MVAQEKERECYKIPSWKNHVNCKTSAKSDSRQSYLNEKDVQYYSTSIFSPEKTDRSKDADIIDSNKAHEERQTSIKELHYSVLMKRSVDSDNLKLYTKNGKVNKYKTEEKVPEMCQIVEKYSNKSERVINKELVVSIEEKTKEEADNEKYILEEKGHKKDKNGRLINEKKVVEVKFKNKHNRVEVDNRVAENLGDIQNKKWQNIIREETVVKDTRSCVRMDEGQASEKSALAIEPGVVTQKHLVLSSVRDVIEEKKKLEIFNVKKNDKTMLNLQRQKKLMKEKVIDEVKEADDEKFNAESSEKSPAACEDSHLSLKDGKDGVTDEFQDKHIITENESCVEDIHSKEDQIENPEFKQLLKMTHLGVNINRIRRRHSEPVVKMTKQFLGICLRPEEDDEKSFDMNALKELLKKTVFKPTMPHMSFLFERWGNACRPSKKQNRARRIDYMLGRRKFGRSCPGSSQEEPHDSGHGGSGKSGGNGGARSKQAGNTGRRGSGGYQTGRPGSSRRGGGDEDGDDKHPDKRKYSADGPHGEGPRGEQEAKEGAEEIDSGGVMELPHGKLDMDIRDAIGILSNTEAGGGDRTQKKVSQQFAICLIHHLGPRRWSSTQKSGDQCILCLYLESLLKHVGRDECSDSCKTCAQFLLVLKRHLQGCIIVEARKRSVRSSLSIETSALVAGNDDCEVEICRSIRDRISDRNKELTVASLENLWRKKKLWPRIKEHLHSRYKSSPENVATLFKEPLDLSSVSMSFTSSLQSGNVGSSLRSGFQSGGVGSCLRSGLQSGEVGVSMGAISGSDSVFTSMRAMSRAPGQPTIPEEDPSLMSPELSIHAEPDIVAMATQSDISVIYQREEQRSIPSLTCGDPLQPWRGRRGMYSLPVFGGFPEDGGRQRLGSEQLSPQTPTGPVSYGTRRDLETCANKWEEMKQRKGHQNLSEEEEGIILKDEGMSLKLVGGHYRKHHEWQRVGHLGNGVFGKCHLAVDLNNSFQFCVKRIHLEKFDASELVVWSSLKHPNICRMFGAIRKLNKVYIFSDFIDGGSLAELIEEQGQLNSWMALFYFRQLVEILRYLQQSGVIHDDLKADNILLRANTLQIVLIDFGLCQQMALCSNPRVATNVTPVGAQTQWSPEKAASEGYDVKAMVWAAGCVLNHMLSGHYTWTRHYGQLKMLHLVIKEKSPPLWEIPAGLPHAVVDLITRCWEVDPQKRPSPAELQSDPAFSLLERNFQSGTFMQHIRHSLQNETVPSVVRDMDRLISNQLTQSLRSVDLYGVDEQVQSIEGASSLDEMGAGQRLHSRLMMSGQRDAAAEWSQGHFKGQGQEDAGKLAGPSFAMQSAELPNLSIFNSSVDAMLSKESVEVPGQVKDTEKEEASNPNPPVTQSSLGLNHPEPLNLDITFNVDYKSHIVSPPDTDIKFAPSPGAVSMVPIYWRQTSRDKQQTNSPVSLPNLSSPPLQTTRTNQERLPNQQPLLNHQANMKLSQYQNPEANLPTVSQQEKAAFNISFQSQIPGSSQVNKHDRSGLNISFQSPIQRQNQVRLSSHQPVLNSRRERATMQGSSYGLHDSTSTPNLQANVLFSRPIHRSSTVPDTIAGISRQTSGFSELMSPSSGTTTSPSPIKSIHSSGVFLSMDNNMDFQHPETYTEGQNPESDDEEVTEKHESEVSEKIDSIRSPGLNHSPPVHGGRIKVTFINENGCELKHCVTLRAHNSNWQEIVDLVAQSIHRQFPDLVAFTVLSTEGQPIDLSDSVAVGQETEVRVVVVPALEGGQWIWRIFNGALEYNPNFDGPIHMV